MIDVDLNQVSIPLQWSELFGRDTVTDVEIGSGKGRFLLEWAAARPERNMLAVERAGKYHRLCCERAARRGLANVRLIRTTAEDLLFRLLSQSAVATLFTLFPDPWPKKKHHKRRLFTRKTVDAMTAVLEPGGRLLVKSDHVGYAEVIREVLDAAPGLRWIDAERAFAGLPISGFERKYLDQGRPIYTFACERLSDTSMSRDS
jgi:tRNA (guanine-N7-)-methyltransferase